MVVKKYRTVCPKDCFGSCSLEVEVEKGRIIKVRGDRKHPVTKGVACLKGNKYPDIIYSKDRLMYPLRRTGKRGEGEFKVISWDKALDEIYSRLQIVKKEYGPESLFYYAGYGTLGLTNKYSYGFWYQFGGFTTTYGSLCNSAGSEAIKLTYGEIKHNSLSDLENSDLIILWGKNPFYTHPQMMFHINKAVKKGAKLVTIDPRRNESSRKSNLHLSPEAGTDGALALGIANSLISSGDINRDFIDKYTTGFEKYRELVKDYTLEKVSNITGIPVKKIEEFIDMIKEHPRYSLITGYGLQRYTNSGQTLRAISLLPALTGSIGYQGATFYYSDKQGTGLKWPPLPAKPGKIRKIPVAKMAVELSKVNKPPIKAMWVQTANPVTSNPESNKLIEAMKELDFIVVSDLFLTDTAKMADIVLPVTSPFEYYDLIKGYGHSYIQVQQKIIEPPGECKHESEIYKLLGEKFGYNSDYLYDNNRDFMQRVLDLSGYNIDIEEIEENGYLPEEHQEIAFSDFKFKTPSGKIEFYSNDMKEKWGENPLPVFNEVVSSKKHNRYPLQLLTGHSRNRINSQFYNIDELKEDGILQINPVDAGERDIKDGDQVVVYNDRGKVILIAGITDKVREGLVYTEFGSWGDKKKINSLIKARITDIGYNTAFHNNFVEVKKGGDFYESN